MKNKLMLVGVMSILMFNVASASVNREVVSSTYRFTNGAKERVQTFSDGSVEVIKAQELRRLNEKKDDERNQNNN